MIAKPTETAATARMICKSTDVPNAVSITPSADVNHDNTPVRPVPMSTNKSLMTFAPPYTVILHHLVELSTSFDIMMQNNIKEMINMIMKRIKPLHIAIQ